jgi:prephenate dehydratase
VKIEDPHRTHTAFGNRKAARLHDMEILADCRINMVKLESRPIHGKSWQYMFYADLETSIAEPKADAVVEKIKEQIDIFRILNSYQFRHPAWHSIRFAWGGG